MALTDTAKPNQPDHKEKNYFGIAEKSFKARLCDRH